jgi:hypothetical protein
MFPETRIDDALREPYVNRLNEMFAEGKISSDELDERINEALA